MHLSNFAERIESLKAGIVGAIASAVVFGGILLVHSELIFNWNGSFMMLPMYQLPSVSLVSEAIALLSGFLFGVTYRYIIRTDKNVHLKSGAVLAFGLTRGLTQIDVGLSLNGDLRLLTVLLVESVLMFAIARLTLDLALHSGLIKPFLNGFD